MMANIYTTMPKQLIIQLEDCRRDEEGKGERFYGKNLAWGSVEIRIVLSGTLPL